MGSILWEPLRKSGTKILKESTRLQAERTRLEGLLKQLGKWPDISIKAKEEIRDDVFDSFQASNHKEAFAYASANYESLSRYTESELNWLIEWRSALISSCNDAALDIDTTEEDHYPKLRDLSGIESQDWILFGIIRGPIPDDLPSAISFSDVLEQLTKVRNERIRKYKTKYIQDFLRDNPEADAALEGRGSIEVLSKLDTGVVQQFELRSYWESNIHIPRLVLKGASLAVDRFVGDNGHYPEWGLPFPEALIPPEYKPYKTRILSEIKLRARNKVLTQLAKESEEAK